MHLWLGWLTSGNLLVW